MTVLPPEVADLSQANARLQAELRAARDRQNASAEILSAIAGTSGDAERALQQIAEITARLFGAPSVSIQLVENGKWGAAYRFGDSAQRIRSAVPLSNIQIGGQNMPGAVVGKNLQFHIPDLDHLDPSLADWPGLPHARAAGTRTMCGTPLRHEGRAIGALIIYRDRLLPFAPEELALQQSFADQAVIAIENARLFNETREALARQTATSDILRVISRSPTDAKPVFDAIVLASVRLLDCHRAFFLRRDGATYSREAIATPEGLLAERGSDRAPIDPAANFPSRAMVEKKTLHLPDWSLIDLPEHERLIHEKHGVNSALYLPLLRGGECIFLLVLGGKRPGMFGESEIGLAESFRDQALIAIENTRLFNETREALARQTATAEILKVIAGSPSDVQPVFDAIAASANLLIGGVSAAVFRFIAGARHLAAFTPTNPEADEALKASFPRSLDDYPFFDSVRGGNALQIIDTEAEALPGIRDMARLRGYRSMLFFPLMSQGTPIGMIGVSRQEPGTFAEDDVQLLQTFADQAVIAIENVRLFNETKEALERQTATAEILKVIASSPDDVQPVFEAIATSANRLLGGFSCTVVRFIDGSAHLKAFTVTTPKADEILQSSFPQPVADFAPFQLAQAGEVTQIPDTEAMTGGILEISRARGFRSMLFAPLMNKGESIGTIGVTRVQPGAFADHHVQLLKTFADQAVIAIENVRLFNETREALARQTATSEILNVIASSPNDVQPVFDVIVERAVRLCGGRMGRVYRYEDGMIHLVAGHGLSVPGLGKVQEVFPRPAADDTTSGRAIRSRQPNFVIDIESDASVPPLSRQMIEALGTRSQVTVPMLRSGEPIGAITVGWAKPAAYGDQQVELLKTFADQAVIAIENVRLFNETREALERQTATADILKVIAGSPSDVQPVFEAIVGSAAKLFEPCAATIVTLRDEKLHWKATAALHPAFDVERPKAIYPLPFRPDHFPSARAIAERRIVEIPDSEAPGTADTPRQAGRISGFRSATFVPLINGAQGIGTIILTHPQAGFRLSEKQLALVQTFADQAVIAIENARLFNETQEALERQTATADILKVIASSPSDVQPVFEAIATSANRLIGGFSSTVFRFIDGVAHLKAFTPTTPAADQVLQATFPRPVADFPPFKMTQAGEVTQIPDTEALSDEILDIARARGYRSMLFTPLMNDGVSIGFIAVTRVQPGSFADHHVQLLRTFADQAVIAIENARLFDEVQAKTRDLTESLQQQTATANVLEVISRSAFDLNPVFETVAENSVKLCGSDRALIFRFDGELLQIAAGFNAPHRVREWLERNPIRPGRHSVAARAALERRTIQVEDVLADPEHTYGAKDIEPFRTVLGVPMVKGDDLLGVILVYHNEVRQFTDKQIALIETFADQAVIAIENVRLFDEVQAKTRDLSEALTYQTGSGNILKVIASSPTDVGPVLKAIVDSACELCDANDAVVLLREGDELCYSAHHGPIPVSFERLPISRDWITGRVVVDKVPVHVHDAHSAEAAEFPEGRRMSRDQGYRTILSVPLLREAESIGAIVLRRTEVQPFSVKQIALLQTFADQAVIAIGNVRLFDEVQERTEDLRESLQFQTATSDVLKVISSSPDSLQPVLDVIVETCRHLCGTETSTIFLLRDEKFHIAAASGAIPEYLAYLQANPIAVDQPGSVTARAAREKRTVHIPDISADPEFGQGPMSVGERRALLSVPLIRDGVAIGVITMRQSHLTPFTERQIEVVQTFADQAVIAISNVRLFEEVRARTEDLRESLQVQTATSEVLKVISRSPDALQPVLDAIVETSRELCGSDAATMFLLRDDQFHFTAVSGVVPKHLEFLRTNPAPIDGPTTVFTRVAQQKRTAHYPNVMDDPELQGRSDRGGPRALLVAPLMRDGEIIGTIVLRQSHLKPFTPRQIEAIEVFADQAVIAISNVGLFEQVQQRTQELSQSLDDLRTAQDRLVQTEKLASLGQLTAGIAHEIKNPLNFVNNFAALSAELTDELNEVLAPAALADKIREEVNELTHTLKDNLEKVVQHGKRADSIVKNMLLHSREGSGDHRPADINALLDESLNLAYHGARAEKREFNVTLLRDFDEMAGQIEVFPQEITRVFLNLISNGFYAVTKRKTENGGSPFEPVLSATTKNLGDTVEIRIRDNGTGIPAEVREKMFNPFFTTKPAGEGTGLGLSMSHDIIVKQHGGRIDVETEPGHFTEFRIVLPRTSNFPNKIRG